MDIDIPKLLEISKKLTEQERKDLDEILSTTFNLGMRVSASRAHPNPREEEDRWAASNPKKLII